MEPLQSYEPLESTPVSLPLEENQEFLDLPSQRVYNNLKYLNKHKALGPDGTLNWLLKEYAELLAQPVGVILNSSFMEQKLPSVWKFVDITPLSKVKQVLDPKKELRPISLTSAFSKIAEDFVVSDCIKQALKKVVDLNQFGNISGSFTVLVLISMVYKWLEATDGPGATVRVFLSDHRKAFDLIAHSF